MARLDWTPPKIEQYAEYQYNVDYAAEVHELKGNRWTDRALNGSNLPQKMIAEYQNYKDLDQAFRATVEHLGILFQGEAPRKSGRLRASFKIEYKNF